MKKLAFLAMAALSTVVLAGCSDDDNQTMPTPTLKVEATFPMIDMSGGTYTLGYAIGNPVEGASLDATTTADWLTVSVTSDSEITVEAQANTSTDARTATINLSYEYSDSQPAVEATVNVEQAGNPAAGFDYANLNPFLGGYYDSKMGMNYLNLIISEEELPDNLREMPRNPDYLYYVIGLFYTSIDANNMPAAGTYTNGYTSGHFGATVYGGEFGYGSTLTEGTIEISYEDGKMTLVAEMTDVNGKTHYLRYVGTPSFE